MSSSWSLHCDLLRCAVLVLSSSVASSPPSRSPHLLCLVWYHCCQHQVLHFSRVSTSQQDPASSLPQPADQKHNITGWQYQSQLLISSDNCKSISLLHKCLDLAETSLCPMPRHKDLNSKLILTLLRRHRTHDQQAASDQSFLQLRNTNLKEWEDFMFSTMISKKT